MIFEFKTILKSLNTWTMVIAFFVNHLNNSNQVILLKSTHIGRLTEISLNLLLIKLKNSLRTFKTKTMSTTPHNIKTFLRTYTYSE